MAYSLGNQEKNSLVALAEKLFLIEHFVVDSEGKTKFIGWDRVFKDGLYHGYISIDEKGDSFFISVEKWDMDGSNELICKVVTSRMSIFTDTLDIIGKFIKL